MKNGKISDLNQICSLRRYMALDGEMKGLNVIDCHNGKMHFIINESKALDIMQIYYCGENISFVSKNGFKAREIPFLKRFEGGMLYTCGLDCVGEVEGHELHGTLHNTPAILTRMDCTEEGIIVEGYMRDTALFGKNLLLKRRISSIVGSDRIEIEDTLINEGTKQEEYALLYHVNLGYPFLDEGGELVVDPEQVRSRNEWAKAHVVNWKQIQAPKDNFEETCYFLDMKDGNISYIGKDKKFTMQYTKGTLPKFIVWKSMANGDYALGFEPSTTELDEGYSLSIIEPNEKKVFKISMIFSKE
jgi:hypothetical protein